MSLQIVPGYDYPEIIKSLFAEYTDMLVRNDPDFQNYLNLQNYQQEVQHLEEKYGFPDGRLYLAFYDGEVAGSIALRKIDDQRCELKRLYTVPAFRGKHIAKALVKKIIADARSIGYQEILLDTLPFLQTAIHLYKSMGFYETESYNNSPMDHLIYLKYDLN